MQHLKAEHEVLVHHVPRHQVQVVVLALLHVGRHHLQVGEALHLPDVLHQIVTQTQSFFLLT